MHLTDLPSSIFAMLERDGFQPKRISDGIVVEIEKAFYVLRFQAGDAEFIQLSYPNLWEAEHGTNFDHLASATAFANSNCKLAKLVIHERSVSCVVEVLVNDAVFFYGRMHRYISAIKYANSLFYNAMKSHGYLK